jgi:hypothetical protein
MCLDWSTLISVLELVRNIMVTASSFAFISTKAAFTSMDTPEHVATGVSERAATVVVEHGVNPASKPLPAKNS